MACNTAEISSSHFLLIKMIFIVSRNMTIWWTLLYSLASCKIEILHGAAPMSSQPQLVVDLGILAIFISKTNSLILLRPLEDLLKTNYCIFLASW